VLFDKTNPFNPINRRISIIVMNKEAEEAAQKDGGAVEVDAENVGQQEILAESGVLPASGAVTVSPPAAFSASGVAAPLAPPVGAGR
jgi:chemotaxis protein MotB